MLLKMSRCLVAAMILAVMGCGGGSDYDEFVEVNTQFIDAMETYLQEIDKADSAEAMAEAIENYAEKMDELAPRMKAVANKYPELADRSKAPDELKALQEKAQSVAEQIPGTFMKSMKYIMDPQVQQAQQKLQTAMAKMN